MGHFLSGCRRLVQTGRLSLDPISTDQSPSVFGPLVQLEENSWTTRVPFDPGPCEFSGVQIPQKLPAVGFGVCFAHRKEL